MSRSIVAIGGERSGSQSHSLVVGSTNAVEIQAGSEGPSLRGESHQDPSQTNFTMHPQFEKPVCAYLALVKSGEPMYTGYMCSLSLPAGGSMVVHLVTKSALKGHNFFTT